MDGGRVTGETFDGSRRSVDRLALNLFGQLCGLQQADQRFVLQTLDAYAVGVSSPRMEFARAAVCRFFEDTGGPLSKRRYEAWRRSDAAEKGTPSATFLTNTFGTWSGLMDALGLEPAPQLAARRLLSLGAVTDAQAVDAVRECARALGVGSLRFREYRAWAMSELADPGGRRALLISPNTFITRFGSWVDALLAAGLNPTEQGWRSLPAPRSRYAPERLLAVLRDAQRDHGTAPLTMASYERWRRRRRMQYGWAAGALPAPKTLLRRWGSWPALLAAAGILTGGQASTRFIGRGNRLPAHLVEEAVLRAASEVGGPLRLPSYERWRAHAIAGEPGRQVPSKSVVLNHFGAWRAVERFAAQHTDRRCGGAHAG